MSKKELYIKDPIKEFDQGIVIEELKQRYKNNETNSNIINDIKDGMCYMLSIEWLMQLLGNNNLSPKDVFPNMGNYEIEGEIYNFSSKDLAYFMQIADNFYKYSADFDLSNYGYSEHPGAEVISNSRLSEIDKHYIELCSKGKHTVCDWDYCIVSPKDLIRKDYIEAITNKLLENKGILLEIYVNEKINENDYKTKFAHAMAIWQDINSYYFFDPNFGIYESNDITSFLDETEVTYEDVYRDNYEKDISDLDSIKFTFSFVK